MAKASITPTDDIETIREVLDSPEMKELIELATEPTGRPGYGVRAMIGMILIRDCFNIAYWSRVERMVRGNPSLEALLGGVPTKDACYRFQRKLANEPALAAIYAHAIQAPLRDFIPEYGANAIAIDGSDVPSYSSQRYDSTETVNGEKFKNSDSDARKGRRSGVNSRSPGWFVGYKLHMGICSTTELPMSWTLTSANCYEGHQVEGLLDDALDSGFRPKFAIMDKGYDAQAIHSACEVRKMHPIIPLQGGAEKANGKDQPPSCDHGTWKFAGSAVKRHAAKWRCPTGECDPASTWITASRLQPLVPRYTARWQKLYDSRTSVERGFGRLKNEYGMRQLHTRGIDRVRVHVEWSILTQLAFALAKARRMAIRAEAEPIAA